MCGIIGYIGHQFCVDLLYHGLETLSYRGYDSSGLVVLSEGQLVAVKAEGKIEKLQPLLSQLPSGASIGMGHTRWATHGVPSHANAHPHSTHRLSLIHNGIIENYQELKIELLEKGKIFQSDTDSEVVLLLIEDLYEKTGSILESLLQVTGKLRGAYAIGLISADHPDHIYMIKQGSPVAIGLSEGQNFFASDALPLLPYTKNIIFLDDGEIACLSSQELTVYDFYGSIRTKQPVEINWDATSGEKAGYRHYMLKEIHEQPSMLRKTLDRLIDWKELCFVKKNIQHQVLPWSEIERVIIVGCGTAYYAGLVLCPMLEQLWQVPVQCELASEFRYRSHFLTQKTLIIPMTQSGETADTLACVKYAKERGSLIFSICNVPHSSIPRESHGALLMEAGPEIGVASTKAFTSMLLNLYLFGLAVSEEKGLLSSEKKQQSLSALKILPSQLEQGLQQETLIADIAGFYQEAQSCLFVGRGNLSAIALEGALKLKEISYIHAEGYAGGELKHGPIALIDEHMPVVAVVGSCFYREKMISNMEEIKARKGNILGIGPQGDDSIQRLCSRYIPCPSSDDSLAQAILSVVPLQLFSYYVAVHRGTDVDQPRNLAKSVTVE